MAVEPINTASQIQADFMRLLITQLQHQDPLEPMDNYQMSSQLTLFSQLQQLESANQNFAKMLDAAEKSYANSLIGKEISFLDSLGDSKTGVVTEVQIGEDGRPRLIVDGDTIALDAVQSVRQTQQPITIWSSGK
ncbi:MAG: flagellar hook capping FlgD N-terminal domain-containing protein [Sedimentisphaerales bacterium]|nr:flagellar hook capping FlgD N-terminal domain-containing protein [Sedimentisphaerales bacterium]